jgi:Zn-dependent metalloprotease
LVYLQYTSNCHSNKHPICFIIPPFELEEFIKNGTPEERDAAMKTLEASARIRGERSARRLISSTMLVSIGQKSRTVCDAKNTIELPGQILRREGAVDTGDMAADEAYKFCGDVYDFYKAVFNRNSLDDNGLELISSVHYSINFENAFWNSKQMVYGDGGILWNRPTSFIDVIGHEMTHGVTEKEAALDYFREPGALNESISDVMGILVKQYFLKQSASQSNWLIGEGLLRNAPALRSMKEPGFRGRQPAHMDDYVHTTDDDGGVHINSGIPNRAFYLTSIEIGGNAWEKAGKIWYIALRDRIKQYTTFGHAAAHTFEVAGSLFGPGSKEQEAVRHGWEAVGVQMKKLE